MSYWSYNKPSKEEDVSEYVNKFGQTIKINDQVHWPTWTAGISTGKVTRIIKYTFVVPEWNWAVRDPATGRQLQTGSHEEVKHHLRVQKEWSKVVIYHAYRVFKLEAPCSGP